MIIAPSVLSLDYTKFNEQVSILNENVKWLHFDVMDGNFVPNLSFGPDILKCFRKSSNLFLDVHLMVKDPSYFSDVFINNGADLITFHIEALDNDIEKAKELIKKIKEKYVKVGISIKPNTKPETIEPLLKDIDLVLIMSVEPGYGGQSFLDSAYSKIEYYANYRKENNLNYFIEIDGGINDQNSHNVVEKGVDVLVAGSFIFNGDIKANVDKLLHTQ